MSRLNSRNFQRTTSVAPIDAEPGYLRSFGFRRCYRRPTVFHAVQNLRCNCLRVELPVEAQAKSSCRLATDFERMHRERVRADAAKTMEESLPGFTKAWDKQETGGAGARRKSRRLSTVASKTPNNRVVPVPAPRDDKSIRSRLTSARDAGLLGAVEKRGAR